MKKVKIKELKGTYRTGYQEKFLEWSIPLGFFIIGLPLGLFIGGYGALLLLTKFNYRPDEACLLEKIIIIGGIMFGIFYAFFLAYGGRFISRWIGEFIYGKRLKNTLKPVIRTHSLIGDEKKRDIENSLYFLKPYSHLLHAIVLVGSSVYKTDRRGSDIDVVLICKKKGYNIIRDIVFQREIDEQFEGCNDNNIEFTVLSEKLVIDEFRNCSPFSYSLRYGLKLYSNGFLEKIESRSPLSIPSRKYIIKSLYNGVVTQYYGSLKDISKDIKRAHSSSGICTQRGICQGHGPAERLLNVIMKMLYITLPIHGYMPLTKADVTYFADRVYGDDTARIIDNVISMIREDVTKISESQYNCLRKLSTRLFLEILQYAGFTIEIKNLIKDVLYMKQGDYQRIKSPVYRKCITS